MYFIEEIKANRDLFHFWYYRLEIYIVLFKARILLNQINHFPLPECHVIPIELKLTSCEGLTQNYLWIILCVVNILRKFISYNKTDMLRSPVGLVHLLNGFIKISSILSCHIVKHFNWSVYSFVPITGGVLSLEIWIDISEFRN